LALTIISNPHSREFASIFTTLVTVGSWSSLLIRFELLGGGLMILLPYLYTTIEGSFTFLYLNLSQM
jgi:hypothetical protein